MAAGREMGCGWVRRGGGGIATPGVRRAHVCYGDGSGRVDCNREDSMAEAAKFVQAAWARKKRSVVHGSVTEGYGVGQRERPERRDGSVRAAWRARVCSLRVAEWHRHTRDWRSGTGTPAIGVWVPLYHTCEPVLWSTLV